MKLNFKSHKDLVDQNTRYMDILYQEEKELFDRKKTYLGRIPKLLDTLEIPTGYIIEAGVWKGDIYKIFQSYFGKENCIGFDIEKYIDDDSIIYGDFRNIHGNYNTQCSLFFNGLGSWTNNYSSKLSGLEYAINNLVINGYYFDTNIPSDRKPPVTDCLEYQLTNFFNIYRKIK
jgi:hypothetical protein